MENEKDILFDEFDVYIKIYSNGEGETKEKIEIVSNKAYHEGLIKQLKSRGANIFDTRPETEKEAPNDDGEDYEEEKE